MRLVRAAAVVVGLSMPVGLTVACGSRTGLFLSPTSAPSEDAGTVPTEDAPFMEEPPPPSEDTGLPPPLDATPLPDAPVPLICADASDTLIYVVTGSNSLLRFNPSSAQFTRIGTLECPNSLPQQPFSMAVNRAGVAYVLYYLPGQAGMFPPPAPGNIFRVDLNNAACTPTSYVAGQGGFGSFGMAFVGDTTDMNETLYVASDDDAGRLGAINETTLTLSLVGTFSPDVENAELTGTGDGRLFAFSAPGGLNSTGSIIAQINKANATVVGETQLPSVTQGTAWAFAFWGGDFYMFTAPNGTNSIVTRYNPTDNSVLNVASYSEEIVGAGVSTCAPER